MMISSPAVADLLGRLQLEPVRVYRNGPRCWVAHVRRDRTDYTLKYAVGGSEWYGPTSGTRYVSSDRLVNEIQIMGALAKGQIGLAGTVPRVIDASTDGEIWVLREFSAGAAMSVGHSNFMFAPAFFEAANWNAALDFVISLQQATEQIRPLFTSKFDGRDYTTLAARIEHARLSQPSPSVEPYAGEIAQWFGGRDAQYDARREVMIHGEMYPPHIFMQDGAVVVIDWENAMLGGVFQDLAALWVRGYDRPEWQRVFVDELEDRGVIADEDDRQVWDTATMLSVLSNLNHLPDADNEPDDTKSEIFHSLGRQVERILRT